VLKRLSALPIDTFLLAMAATVALAALVPARGTAADVTSVAAKAVLAHCCSFFTVPGCSSRPPPLG
jgi:sodium/bile acid cotransporter 7